MGIDLETRIRNVTAVLGPTNTGKTHLAIERMLGHETGMIGLPLRLLAREVYDRIARRIGAAQVALITGEEKIKPEGARYWVCTVEAMPRDVTVDFLAIDEIQLGADPERGHVFTDRLLNARGKLETLMLGAGTMREAVSDLIPGANFISRPRLSKLTYAGQKKITRLPARTAIVTFSASDVYQIAELVRRQRGGAAVVLGALSPRTRNAQVALYQSGDVDYLVATDAIGMGLNLDLDHVAFAQTRKFDGQSYRNLTPAELAQIAGRAGRHMNDGTFFVTGDVEPFDSELVDRLENHTFDPLKVLQWRNSRLDTSTLHNLRESLRELPREARLTRARMADDVAALETLAEDAEIRALTTSRAAVERLWEACQIPDYRKISSTSHADLIATLYRFLMGPSGRIDDDWFARQIEQADRTDGDIDTLSTRLAHIRTWTFVSNRSDWLVDPLHWQERTRTVEDKLSDALHVCLAQRFIDKRTSALMKGMRDKDELSAEIAADGSLQVENHFVGRLKGFRFEHAADAEGVHGKAARNAAAQVLSKELAMRVRRVTAARNDAFRLNRHARIVWREEEIARLEPGEDAMKPTIIVLADDHLAAADRDRVQERLQSWLSDTVGERLKPLVEIARAEDVTGLARGIAFRLTESLAALRRDTVADEIKSLDQNARAQLRRYGVRFGAFNIYFPLLLKPAPADLALTLWILKFGPASGLDIAAPPEPPRAGLTSMPVRPELPEAYYRAAGYHVCGSRAVRIDILERLADLIRSLLSWKPAAGGDTAPRGATGEGAFTLTPEMMSILGCSPEELGSVLRSLGFRSEKRAVPRVAATPPGGESAADLALQAALRLASPAASDPGVAPAPEPAADGSVSATEAEAAPAEVVVELWRPRRRERAGANEGRRGRDGHRHRGRGPRRDQQHAAANAATGTPQAASADLSGTPGASGSEQRPPGSSESRHDHGQRRRDSDRRPQRGGEGGDDRSQRAGPEAGGPGRGGNDANRPPRRRDDRGPRRERDDQRRPVAQYKSAPTRRQGTVDPDSPFAKLGVLKEELEKRSREPSN